MPETYVGVACTNRHGWTYGKDHLSVDGEMTLCGLRDRAHGGRSVFVGMTWIDVSHQSPWRFDPPNTCKRCMRLLPEGAIPHGQHLLAKERAGH